MPSTARQKSTQVSSSFSGNPKAMWSMDCNPAPEFRPAPAAPRSKSMAKGPSGPLWHYGRIEQLDAIEHAGARFLRLLHHGVFEAGAHLPLQIKQRAHRVDSRPPARRLAKQIIENLERERSGITRQQDLLEEALKIELALPRKATVVPGPLQHVHRQHGCVGELQEENPVAGYLGK